MIKKLLLATFFLAAVSGASFSAALIGDPMVEKAELYIQRSDNTVIEADFVFPGVEIEQVTNGQENFDRFFMSGEGYRGTLGAPELPVVTRLFAIPDRAEVKVRKIEPQYKTYQGYSAYPHQEHEYGSAFNTDDLVIEAEYYQRDEFYPPKWVELSKPAVMRDLRIVPVNINPVRVNPVSGEVRVLTGLHLELEFEDGSVENVKTRRFEKSVPSFNNFYRNLVSNYDWTNPNGEEVKGSILIVYPTVTGVASILQPYIEWKKRRGYSVSVVGVTNNASTTTVGNIIDDKYFNSDPPLEHVILIGDATGTIDINCYSYSGGDTDHTYALIEGGDIVADVNVGRISVDNVTRLQTAINKILYYEMNPIAASTNWYKRGAVTAGSGSGISTIFVNKTIRAGLLESGFTEVDTLWYTMGGSIPSFIVAQCNEGITALNYRGYWGISGFGTGNIYSMNNPGKLPFAVVITCGTGDFGSYSEAVSEAWLRAGSPNNPTGGIGGVSTATLGTNTRFNNTMCGGLWFGLYNEGISQLGPLTFRGKHEIFITYQLDQSGMNNFTYWNNLMGDPSTEMWTDIPQTLSVTHADEIYVGATSFTVTVEDASGEPLEDRYVTLLKEGEVFVGGPTDENGIYSPAIDVQTEGELLVTVTYTNDRPYLGSADVTETNVYPSFYSLDIDDDNSGASQGNSDGNANPGEILEFAIELKNYGILSLATAVSATLSSTDEHVTVLNAASAYPNISAGLIAAGDDLFTVELAGDFPHEYVVPFVLTVDATQGQFISAFNLAVTSAELNIIGAEFAGGTLEPGSSDEYTLTIRNNGGFDLEGVTGTVTCDDPQITIEDNTCSFGDISAGSQASSSGDFLVIAADEYATNGRSVEYQIVLTSANGFEQTIDPRFIIGAMETNDPFGPDSHGYYCIDNTDFEYSGAPNYEWVDISSLGTQLNLPDYGTEQDASTRVDLPFDFTFYGETFNVLTVCSNGWLAFGNQTYFVDFRNYPIPSSFGAGNGMLCPFWDDLKMGSGHVYSYYDEAGHIYIVEYHNVQHNSGGGETFQVILYDPEHYPTPTGDGEILFQYQTVTIVTGPYSDNDYATVGIENHEHNDGLEYCYWNVYHPGAPVLQGGRAIKFTTIEPLRQPLSSDVQVTMTPINPPIVIPAGGGNFDFHIAVENTGTTQSVFDAWAYITLPSGTQYGPTIFRQDLLLTAGASLSRDLQQTIPANAPAGTYSYTAYTGDFDQTEIWDEEGFDFEKTGVDLSGGFTEWLTTGWGDAEISDYDALRIPASYNLSSAVPNPFNPVTEITFALPEAGNVKLVVFNSLGRQIAVLEDGWKQSGWHSVTFDGAALSSGIYFYSLRADNFVQTKKMLLVK